MFCKNCGKPNRDGSNFCRSCGTDIVPVTAKEPPRDLDELTGKGIRDVIIGDGFFLVAIILGLTTSAVSGLLWLSLLIPAFYFFGKGFSNVLYVRQIRKRLEGENLIGTQTARESLPSTQDAIAEVVRMPISGEIIGIPSVTEQTTRRLEKGRL